MRYNDSMFGDNSVKPDTQDFTTTSQIRELYSRLNSLQSTVANVELTIEQGLGTQVTDTTTVIPPMTNFVDNSDFSLTHYAYSMATDATTLYILAKWYAREQSSNGIYAINTDSYESPQSIRAVIPPSPSISYSSIVDNLITITGQETRLGNGMPVKITGSSLSTTTDYIVLNYTLTANATTFNLASVDDQTVVLAVTAAAGGSITTEFTPRTIKWDTSRGVLPLSGGWKVATVLNAKYAGPGNLLHFRMSVAHSSKVGTGLSISNGVVTWSGHGLVEDTEVVCTESSSGSIVINKIYTVASSPQTNSFTLIDPVTNATASVDGGGCTIKTKVKDGLIAKISIIDNTTGGTVFTGTTLTLTSTKSGAHPNGATTRYYLLEAIMENGQKLYSSTNPLDSESLTIPVTSTSDTNFVIVSWPRINGVSRYNLYRNTTNSQTNWHLVSSASSGTDSLYDYGGEGTSVTLNVTETDQTGVVQNTQKALAFVRDVTNEISRTQDIFSEINVTIQFPSYLDSALLSHDQAVQIEFTRANGGNTTLSDIPEGTLLLDKVALSYVYGRWHPSSRDMALLPSRVNPTVVLPSGGDGGGSGGTIGSGEVIIGSRCVHTKTPILVWSEAGEHFWLPASEIVVGDVLVAWDGQKIEPSRVRRIINGISRMNYRLWVEDRELVCSFSHRVIADMDDFDKGTNVGKLDKTAVIYDDGVARVCEIEGIESFAAPMQVITFMMETGRQNYVSGGIFSHNNKEVLDIPIAV